MTLQEFETILLGGKGSLHVNDTTARTGITGKTIEVIKDAVIANCKGVDNAGTVINFVTSTDYLWTTIYAGTTLYAGAGITITELTLTSGTVKFNRS